MIERLNREIRRRTRVVGTFPDGNSALMLVCAWLRHVAGTGQHQGDKFVVPSLCGADAEVHQAVNQVGKRYIAHIVQTWYEVNKNKGIMF